MYEFGHVTASIRSHPPTGTPARALPRRIASGIVDHRQHPPRQLGASGAAIHILLRPQGGRGQHTRTPGRHRGARSAPAGRRKIYSKSIDILTRSGKQLGSMGIISADTLRRFDIKQPVAYAELRWQELPQMAAARKVTLRRCRSRCPYSATSPCSSTAPSHSTRYSAQSPKAKRLLRNVTLFDVYEGRPPAGRQEVLRNLDHTPGRRTHTRRPADRNRHAAHHR